MKTLHLTFALLLISFAVWSHGSFSITEDTKIVTLDATAIIGDIGFKVESLTTGINLKDADGTITIAQHERNRRIEFIVIE